MAQHGRKWNQNITNARNAGLRIQVGFYPCRYKTPQNQLMEVQRLFGFNAPQRVWFEPLIWNSSACSWEHRSAQENCQYLQSLVAAFNSRGIKTGIIASRQNWASIFGLDTMCSQLKNDPLFWIPQDYEQNNQPNYENYKQIGGWVKPYAKFYQVKTLCGRSYVYSYHQQS